MLILFFVIIKFIKNDVSDCLVNQKISLIIFVYYFLLHVILPYQYRKWILDLYNGFNLFVYHL
jgi:hypothetical protein